MLRKFKDLVTLLRAKKYVVITGTPEDLKISLTVDYLEAWKYSTNTAKMMLEAMEQESDELLNQAKDIIISKSI